MEKIKEKLKGKVKDEFAALAIVVAILGVIVIDIGVNEYIQYMKSVETNANINLNQEEMLNQEEDSNAIVKESVIDEEEAQKKNEEEYEKLKEEEKISSSSPTYYIKVNYKAQVVTIYTKDSNGKYTKPVKAMICSTGTYTPTSGTYRTLAKRNWWPLYGGVYGQYATHIVNGILFHSVPYLRSGDRSSLEYWAYDQLGSRVSMGCVRLTVADAKWIYDNCTIGTQVEFYSSSNPGPLGKPSARKISSAPKNVRGWDPTDPNKNNPWPAYLKSLSEENDKETNNTNSTNNTASEKPSDNNSSMNETTNETVNEIINDINKEPEEENENSDVENKEESQDSEI